MRRSIPMAGAGALLAALYVLYVMPLAGQRVELGETFEAKYSSLKKYESFIKGAKVTENELEAARAELGEMEAGVIMKKDTSLAFAEFQIKVQELAERAGISVLSVQPLRPVEHVGYLGLPLFIEGRAGIRELSAFLKSIDVKHEYIKLDDISVQSPSRRTGDGRKLRIKMQLSGLMKR